MLRPRASVAKPLGERARELELPFRLRRHTERAAGPRLRGRHPLDDARTDGLRRHPERFQGAGREFFGLREQGEEQVLGADVVVPERARFAGGARERSARALIEPRRPRLARRRDRDEALLRRLLADPESASNLRPTAAGRPCRLHEVVDELVRAPAYALRELECRGQPLEWVRVPTLRLNRLQKARKGRFRFHRVKLRLTFALASTFA